MGPGDHRGGPRRIGDVVPAARPARLVRDLRRPSFPPARGQDLSQQELAERFRALRDQIRYAVEQTNREFARLFRDAVAGQVASETEIDAEIRDIEQLVTG